VEVPFFSSFQLGFFSAGGSAVAMVGGICALLAPIFHRFEQKISEAFYLTCYG